MKGKNGKVLIITGLLLLAAAFSLSMYNMRENRRAEEDAAEILREFRARLEESGNLNPNRSPEGAESPPKEESGEKNSADKEKKGHEMPDVEMPTMEINGRSYIGILEVPSLELELPVQAGWNYPALQISPCRYKGSVYSRDIIIAAHNYTSHFGLLKNLSLGESVKFTDAVNRVFQYEVADMEVMPGTAVEDMEAGDWDMTLFTCVFSGTKRVAVRCELI